MRQFLLEAWVAEPLDGHLTRAPASHGHWDGHRGLVMIGLPGAGSDQLSLRAC